MTPAFTSEAQARHSLRARAQAGRAWLFEAALPLWWAQGFDRESACYHEQLDANGAPMPVPRRVRVQARQTAVYAIAGDLGWDGPWREAMDAGVAVMLGAALRPDGGVHHMLDARGAPLDPRGDLYNTTFIIFGLAHAARVGPRAPLLAAAEAHLDWIDAHWRHPLGGFREGDLNPVPPRRQNPHMHFFEALLTLFETTRDPEHGARADELFTLFTTRIYDPERGSMAEFFDDGWRPASGDAGRHAEPGHQFEWSWLLHRYSALRNAPLHEGAARLCQNAERLGVDPARNVARDAIWIDGGAKAQTARLWPQTERVKAHARMFAQTRDLASAASAAAAFDSMMRYLDTPTPGLWRDRMLANGAFADEPSPASSFYHIMLALDEFVRLFDPPA